MDKKDDLDFTSIGSFEKFVFPMIKSVWPNLLTLDYCSLDCETCKEENEGNTEHTP